MQTSSTSISVGPEARGGPIIAIDDLVSGYSGSRVLGGLCLHVERGDIVAVIGRNGAGKTTLFKTAMGLLSAYSGRISFDGIDISASPTEVRARHGIGYVPQGRGIFPNLSVRENLIVGEKMNAGDSAPNHQLAREFFPILLERRNQLAGSLSGGQQQMLSIGRIVVGGARLMLLDEPSEGIQPSIVQQLGEILLLLNSRLGTTIVFAEQNASLIKKLARRCVVLEKGIIVADVQVERLTTAQLEKFLSI